MLVKAHPHLTEPMTMYGTRSKVLWTDRNLFLLLLIVGRCHGLRFFYFCFLDNDVDEFSRPDYDLCFADNIDLMAGSKT